MKNITGHLSRSLIAQFKVIEETIIPCKGRLQFFQFIKNKAHKYGIELFKLSTLAGYTYAISKSKDEEKSETVHEHDVVI